LDELRFEGWSKTALAFLDRPPHFLAREELIALPVPPPPSNGSPETRAELDTLLTLQARRTRAEQQSIEAHRDYAAVCEAILRAAHPSSKVGPRARALLAHVEQDASLAVFHAKKRFNRPRPHQLEPRLHPCLAVPGHPAYPSGHALQGYLVARVLSLVFSDRLEAVTAAGALIGHEREIAGLHYPSDAAASRALGEALFARLETNEAFRAEVDSARAEWLRGLSARPGPAADLRSPARNHEPRPGQAR
jgi:hypothetical protein